MPAPKGTRPPAAGRGRKKGAANRVTREIKAMIEEAVHLEGGVDYLRWAARQQPVAFLSLLARTLPKDVRAKLEGTGENGELRHIVETHIIDHRPESRR